MKLADTFAKKKKTRGNQQTTDKAEMVKKELKNSTISRPNSSKKRGRSAFKRSRRSEGGQSGSAKQDENGDPRPNSKHYSSKSHAGTNPFHENTERDNASTGCNGDRRDSSTPNGDGNDRRNLLISRKEKMSKTNKIALNSLFGSSNLHYNKVLPSRNETVDHIVTEESKDFQLFQQPSVGMQLRGESEAHTPGFKFNSSQNNSKKMKSADGLGSAKVGDQSISNMIDDEDDDGKEEKQDQEEEEELAINLKGGIREYTNNMKNFIDYYGVQIQIPGLYILDAKFYPLKPTLCLQSIALVNSAKSDMSVRTCYLDGKQTVESMEETWRQSNNIHGYIRLTEIKEKRIQIKKTIRVAHSNKNIFQFSPNGQYMALFLKKQRSLRIYTIAGDDSDSLIGLLNSVEGGESGATAYFKNEGFAGIKHLKFDGDSSLLACYGNRRVFIFKLSDFEKPQKEEESPSTVFQHEINSQKFSRILDL